MSGFEVPRGHFGGAPGAPTTSIRSHALPKERPLSAPQTTPRSPLAWLWTLLAAVCHNMRIAPALAVLGGGYCSYVAAMALRSWYRRSVVQPRRIREALRNTYMGAVDRITEMDRYKLFANKSMSAVDQSGQGLLYNLVHRYKGIRAAQEGGKGCGGGKESQNESTSEAADVHSLVVFLFRELEAIATENVELHHRLDNSAGRARPTPPIHEPTARAPE